ncbi:MAG TPA: hypothetical protein VKY59_05345 [Spirillospora sp.]|nr:hypothetical protein [Spirillospora sp.]
MGGKTYLDAKPGHLVNRAQRLNIVSSEAVRRAGEHVGESALTRISQHLLVVLTISGCPGVVVDVFAQISECMTAHQPLVYIPALGRL